MFVKLYEYGGSEMLRLCRTTFKGWNLN